MLTTIGANSLSKHALALLMPKVDFDNLQLQEEVVKKFRPTLIPNLPVEREGRTRARNALT